MNPAIDSAADLRWPFAVRQLTPTLGAEISGVALADRISEEVFDAIHRAYLRYQVLLFPPQEMPSARQVEFCRHFGKVQVWTRRFSDTVHPEIYRISNLDEHGKPTGRHPDKLTLEWHTDTSYQRVTGGVTTLYGEMIPDNGGETHFCDMYGAYERLSSAWKARIAGLRAVHNLNFTTSRRQPEAPLTDVMRLATPPVDHPVVRTHGETGRKCLYLGDHAESIVGMPYEQGRALVDELNALAVHPDLVYEHHWKPGQFILWDNRCLTHRATSYDVASQPRVVRRCTALGDIPA